jgi:hypothetical protein
LYFFSISFCLTEADVVVARFNGGEGSEGEGTLDLADGVVEDRLLREPRKLSLVMEKKQKNGGLVERKSFSLKERREMQLKMVGFIQHFGKYPGNQEKT